MLTFYVVYDHPTDYPQEYVVRIHTTSRGGTPVAHTDLYARSKDYAYLESHLAEMGLYRLPRDPSDDPVIKETWV